MKLGRERPFCSWDGVSLSGTSPICPRDWSGLSWTESRPKCMLAGFFLARLLTDAKLPTAENMTSFSSSPLVLAQPLCRNVSGILLYEFWRIRQGFSWRDLPGTFSCKNEERNCGDRIREKIRRIKTKYPRKIRSAQTTLTYPLQLCRQNLYGRQGGGKFCQLE